MMKPTIIERFKIFLWKLRREDPHCPICKRRMNGPYGAHHWYTCRDKNCAFMHDTITRQRQNKNL